MKDHIFVQESAEDIRLKMVYRKLLDEESRDIYKARAFYSLLNDKSVLSGIIKKSVTGRTLEQKINEHKDQKLILFGAGVWGNAIISYFNDVDWYACVDNKKSGDKLGSLDIISFEELKRHKDAFVVIAVEFAWREIEKQLLTAGFDEANIFAPGKIVADKQYFDVPGMKFTDEEVFVDIGGLDGATAQSFIKCTENKYKHIHIFEPDKQSLALCRENMRNLLHCTFYPYGVWSKNTELLFIGEGEKAYCAENDNLLPPPHQYQAVRVVALDDVLKGENITFLKIDIEGAEYEALAGAENLIKRCKPKIAIAAYHRRKDIWELPMRLLELNGDYTFYLRVYGLNANETVLYAV